MANVHKDFHGCLSFGLKFLARSYGQAEVEEYLRRVARNVYAPLIDTLQTQGLTALEAHWDRIMRLEEADFDLRYDGDTMLLEVRKCPAINHMREFGYQVCDGFCQATLIVNEEICGRAGYVAGTEYDQENGRCIQRFRREVDR